MVSVIGTGYWVDRFFVERGELFLKIMENMWKKAEEDVEWLVKIFSKYGLNRGSRILDLGCGIGRIAVNLARKGYYVTGIDISEKYIEIARRKAREYNVADSIEFIVGDARQLTKYLGKEYDAVLMYWSTIIGYYDEETDLVIMKQCHEITRDNGYMFVLNTVNRDRVVMTYSLIGNPSYYSEIGDLVVIEKPEFDLTTSRLNSKWVFYAKKGNNLYYIDELEMSLRLYSLHEIVELGRRAGWEFVEVYGDLKMSPFKPVLGGLNIVFKKIE
ncbi:MAG: class I SAM-dependent methyltransferase [Thermoprotei archaeon]